MSLMGLKTDLLTLPWARITGVPAGIGGAPNWADVQGKPTTLEGFGLSAEVQSLAGGGLGAGQVWQDVTANRSMGTTYYNTTGRPIMVAVSMGNSGVTGVVTLNVGGVGVSSYNGAQPYNASQVFAVVPAGSSYCLSNTGTNSPALWSELKG